MPTVGTPSAAWEADHEDRLLPRTLAYAGIRGLRQDALDERTTYKGVASTRKADQRWTWPGPGEKEPYESGGTRGMSRYDDRIKRAVLYPVWHNSLATVAGLPFLTQTRVSGWSQELMGRAQPGKSIDGMSSLHDYLRRRFYAKLVEGISFGGVDMPTAAEIQNGARPTPYLFSLSADSLIDWNWQIVTDEDGEPVVRLLECRYRYWYAPPVQRKMQGADPNRWPMANPVQQVRHYIAGQYGADASNPLSRVHYAIYELEDEKDEESWFERQPYRRLEGRGDLPITDIPIVPFFTDHREPFRDRPPFLDSAEMQADVWRLRSERRVLVRRSCETLLTIPGVSDRTGIADFGFVIGVPDGSRPQLHESNGAVLKETRTDILSDEARIAASNLEPLKQEAGEGIEMTATEVKMRGQLSRSKEEQWVHSDEHSGVQLLQHWERFAGNKSPDGKVELPHDLRITPELLREMREAAQGRRPMMTPTPWLEALKKLGGLDEQFGTEEEAAKVMALWAFGRSGGLREGEELVAEPSPEIPTETT